MFSYFELLHCTIKMSLLRPYLEIIFTILILKKSLYIHTYYSRFIPEGQQRHLRYSSKMPTFYQNYFALRNTTDVTGSNPVAVWSQFVFCKNFVCNKNRFQLCIRLCTVHLKPIPKAIIISFGPTHHKPEY
jgi:hypothetical protein